MEISVSQQCSVFLLSIAAGVLLGFWYDIFRIMRKSIPLGTVLIFVQDCVFWIVAAAATFLFIFVNNSGQVRVFILLGEVGGALIYFLTVSRPVVFICVKVIDFFKKLLKFLFKVIIWPVKMILKPIVKTGKWLGAKLRKCAKRLVKFMSFKLKIKKKFSKIRQNS